MSRFAASFLLVLWTAGCRGERERPLFELLSPSHTGITFANTITTNDSVNVQTDVYVYNGGGVAVGDVNNDGLVDLFFSGNMVSSRLYLNKGDMRFEDVTERAGVRTRRWATGASMVDINNDGHLDIYVSVSGPEWSRTAERANLLFVNDGDGTFTEDAVRYRIGDTGFTTHAIFVDYDRDGCLDLFLLNNSPEDFARGVTAHPAGLREQTPRSYNELYRNDCPGGRAGPFTNVSLAAGILRQAGYGLGAVAADLNRDGWSDIYVSNDGPPNDVVYVNNGDGTFTDKAARWLKHTSAAGMGIDIADFNNDAWPDILQVDMMPRELDRRKTMSGSATYGSMLEWRRRGFRYDYTLNTLQLSNGITKDGDVMFSDIARLAGVAYTGWSWSALFADFDNDGYKDIFISSGYPKAIIDLDYKNAMLGINRRSDQNSRRAARALLETLPAYREVNAIFRNRGDLTFTDMSAAWGMGPPSFSYGAAYADLDNDGRLDLVVNNIDAPPFIYHNVAPAPDESHHYLQVRLEGESSQSEFGSTLIVTAGGQKQYVDHTPYRGFMSTMDDRVHFGLGRATRVDSFEVRWPDGRYQVLRSLEADRLVTVKQVDAIRPNAPGSVTSENGTTDANHRFELVGSRQGLAFGHRIGGVFDYGVQPLLPYMLSRQGPPLAAADVNNDGLDDVFIGGASRAPGRLFVQRTNGTFAESQEAQPWVSDTTRDDWGALFFDANGDELQDLYVASGGYHLTPGSPLLQDRLYINAGGGRFRKDTTALPPMLTSTGAVRAADFNGDGRLDLFVGGRLTPRRYPYPTRSYLLRNDGGRFTDVTEAAAPDLLSPGGMITDAAWVDFDGDGRRDLVTVGEWMSIHFYRNDGERLRNVTDATQLPSMRGWWYSLIATDFDSDGRTDLVAGNLGLNTYTTSDDSPFAVYAGSFTNNQMTDVVLTQGAGAATYPLAGLMPLGREVYTTSVRFPTYGSFARASMRELFSPAQLDQALHYEVDTFASVYLRNTGGGTFDLEPLPSLAQIAPTRAIIADDIDGDGHRDLLIAGNVYDFEPNTPPADAGNGLWLRGDGSGHFAPVPASESGFLAPLNVAGMALIRTSAGRMVVVANTGDSLQVFSVRTR